ncbi:MAG: flagellar filament capping protein FliD [Bryobacterales bacterium]|nr:flagellar filament capping protein FliD [Bryobacterales bacterium]
MSSLNPLRFTGVSSFSEDFTAILQRASQIATLPVKQLQNEQTRLIAKKQSLTALNANLQGLTSAVEKLGEVGRTRSLSVTSSNTTRVSVVNNGVATATSYAITEITSVAKAASETTVSGFATADSTAVDTDNDLELAFGGQTFALTLTNETNNLEGLRDAINESGAGVTATILNTGSEYYLSVTASATGENALELRRTAGDSGSNLLTATNQGANASFKFNGVSVERADNVVADLVPGLTFTILDETEDDETVNITAVSSRGGMATALNDFVDAYNATVDKLNTQIGENAGLLSGDYLVGQVSRTLRQVTGFQGGGTVKSLAELGIELDRTGKMSFNSTKFYSLGSSTIEGAFTFMGSETSGFGGLSRTLDQLSNPISGLIRLQQNNYDAADLRFNSQIADLSTRIERSQLALTEKLQQADVLLARLSSQQTSLEASLKAVNQALYGKD